MTARSRRHEEFRERSYEQVTHDLPEDSWNVNDGFDTEIHINRDYDPYSMKKESREERRVMSPVKRQPSLPPITELRHIDLRSLYVGAEAHTVKQTIDVSRLEDELLDTLPPGKRARQPSTTSRSGPQHEISPLDDYDKVDEKIELIVDDKGRAVLIAKVRSEKITPILGTDEMFKKSSVIVTRRIEVNLTVTPHRRMLYDLIAERQEDYARRRGGSSFDSDAFLACSPEEKAELYRVFMGLAELDKAAAP